MFKKYMMLPFYNADGGSGGSTNNEGGQGNDSSDGSQNTENMIPYERFKQVNDNYKTVKTQLDELIRKQQQAEEDAKKKSGEYENLYTDLKTKYDPLEQQFKQYQDTFKEILTNKLESVPEKFKALVPQSDPIEQMKWLENAEKTGLFKANNVQSFGNNGDNPPSGDINKTNKGFLKGLQRKF